MAVDARIEQLTFYWDAHLWPRLEGLTDAEYRWSPVPRLAFDLQPAEDGRWRYDDAPGDATLVPTLAWRLMHIAVGCFHIRSSTFFGDGSVPDDADMFDPRHRPGHVPGDADGGVAFLADAYHRWIENVSGLPAAELDLPLGPRGAYFAQSSMADLVLHVNRETMHHGGEIGLLRDLWAERPERGAALG